MAQNIIGVDVIRIGLPGDGVVGTSLTDFEAVELGSLNLSGAEVTETTISTEQVDAYATVSEGSNPATASFRLYEVYGDDAVLLMGGDYDDAAQTWKAPVSAPDKYLSVVIRTTPFNGEYAEITFPYAKVVARYEGSLTKSGLLSVEVSLTANTPVAEDGTINSPKEVKFFDV